MSRVSSLPGLGAEAEGAALVLAFTLEVAHPPRRHTRWAGTNLGITSVCLQGIDNTEIIDTVHARRAPMVP